MFPEFICLYSINISFHIFITNKMFKFFRNMFNYKTLLFNPTEDGDLWDRSQLCVYEGGGWQKGPPLHKICPIYATMMKLGTVIPYLLRSKKYINHVPHPSISADISIFFTGNQQIYINKHR